MSSDNKVITEIENKDSSDDISRDSHARDDESCASVVSLGEPTRHAKYRPLRTRSQKRVIHHRIRSVIYNLRRNQTKKEYYQDRDVEKMKEEHAKVEDEHVQDKLVYMLHLAFHIHNFTEYH